MTEHEKYQEHIRHTHDAFCKTVIRHAAIDAARSIRSRRKREISLEYLIEEKHYPFSTTDKYFAEQAAMNSYPLFVCGQMVLLESPQAEKGKNSSYKEPRKTKRGRAITSGSIIFSFADYRK